MFIEQRKYSWIYDSSKFINMEIIVHLILFQISWKEITSVLKIYY